MQRYVRMFGTPITLLVLVGVLFLGAKWGYSNVVAPAPPAPLVPCTSQSVGKALNTSEVSVQVFNGGTVSGLAGTVKSQLQGVGFKVVQSGNTDATVTTTQVIGAAVDDPEVKLVASFFKGAKVSADGRADHTVEVRVGDKATGFDRSAATSLPVSGGVVCLPSPSAIATPSS